MLKDIAQIVEVMSQLESSLYFMSLLALVGLAGRMFWKLNERNAQMIEQHNETMANMMKSFSERNSKDLEYMDKINANLGTILQSWGAMEFKLDDIREKQSHFTDKLDDVKDDVGKTGSEIKIMQNNLDHLLKKA